MSRTVETAGIGLAQATVDPRSFALHGDGRNPRLRWFTEGLQRLMIERGYHEHPEPSPEVQVVLNRIDPERPRPYRRKSAPTFVVALADVGTPPKDVLRAGYPLLVRALANLAVMVSDDGSPAAHFVTLEQGRYVVRHTGDDDEFFAAVFERMEPLAGTAATEASERLRFDGWLELLRVLSELVAAAPPSGRNANSATE